MGRMVDALSHVRLMADVDFMDAARRGDLPALRERVAIVAEELGLTGDELLLHSASCAIADLAAQGFHAAAGVERERLTRAGREFHERLVRLYAELVQLPVSDVAPRETVH